MIYISGKMTGIKDDNYPEFNRVAKQLRMKGEKVFNPAEAVIDKTGLSEQEIYDKFLEEDLKGLETCKSIYLLNGWHRSNGAKIELKRALEKGMSVLLQSEIGI